MLLYINKTKRDNIDLSSTIKKRKRKKAKIISNTEANLSESEIVISELLNLPINLVTLIYNYAYDFSGNVESFYTITNTKRVRHVKALNDTKIALIYTGGNELGGVW